MLEELMNEYEKKIREDVEVFDIQTKEIKNKMIKKMCGDIEDELHRIKGVRVVDNDRVLKEKIDSKIDKIIDEYMIVVFGNKIKQNKQLSHLYDGMHIDEMAGIDFDVIEFKEQKIESITETIVDSVLTHIVFENQNNSMYNQKKNDVKRIVEEEITSKKIKLTIEEINNIYESTLEKMQSEKNNFCMNYNEIQQQTINAQTISPNEQAFMNNDLNQLSTEGIFDDNYESENARRFK